MTATTRPSKEHLAERWASSLRPDVEVNTDYVHEMTTVNVRPTDGANAGMVGLDLSASEPTDDPLAAAALTVQQELHTIVVATRMTPGGDAQALLDLLTPQINLLRSMTER